MSTTLDIKVNDEVYDKYIKVCDAKNLVSTSEITRNFIDGTLVRFAIGSLSKDQEYIEHYSKVGDQANGDCKLEEIYLPSGYAYETIYFSKEGIPDKDAFFRGCLVKEIYKQYKLYCNGKRGRRSY